jgi:hypothetical protein
VVAAVVAVGVAVVTVVTITSLIAINKKTWLTRLHDTPIHKLSTSIT